MAQSGKVVYKECYGEAVLNGTSVSDDTLYRLASMTKPITAVTTMILVERGLLSLDDTVDRFYPSFSAMCVKNAEGGLYKAKEKITVENILTHTSGIGSGAVWNDTVKRMTAENIESVDAFVDFLSKQPLSFSPNSKQEYSGIGAFSVLTGMIQKITDMPYGDFLKKEIFEPCNMQNTTFEPTEQQWKRLIYMHDKRNGKNEIGQTFDNCVFEWIPPQNHLGGAGLISSMEDYFHFAQMLLNGGTYDGKRIVSKQSIDEISRPRVFKGNGSYWGLGVRVVTTNDTHHIPAGSYGWSGAYGTHFWIDPHNEIVGIYLKNSRYDGGSGALTSKRFESNVYSSFQNS